MRKYSKENAEIGARVRTIRQGAGLTQEQFSEKIDVTAAYISELERGMVGISVSKVKQIALEFGVSCDEIIMGSSHSNDVSRIAEKLKHLPSDQADLLENVIDTFLVAIAQSSKNKCNP